MFNTKIENCNNELLEKQKAELRHEIIYGNNKDAFKVFDIEAGCRKTRTAEEALAEMVTLTDKNAIMIRLNNNDCRESADRINKLIGKKVAFAYNNEDVSVHRRKAEQKKFGQYRVLIITHPKYKVLASDTSQRKIFTEGRSILVVDEFISVTEKLELSEVDINTYKALFQYDSVISKAFSSYIKNIEDYFIGYGSYRNYALISNYQINKNASYLTNLIKNNLTNDILKSMIEKLLVDNIKDINVSFLNEIKTVNKLCKQISRIKEFTGEICLMENGVLYTTEKSTKDWLLNNNIILDASGKLQNAYWLDNKRYQLLNLEKVLDHSRWKIINIKVNSTSAAKEKMSNYYDVVNNEIKQYGEDILVIGSKKDLEHIKLPEKNKGYFGNITGSNQWANIGHVAIVQTHNLNDIDYILTYLHYGKDYIDHNTNLKSRNFGQGAKRRFMFEDSRLENIRNLWIASETYQAIKRVNRNMEKDTDVLIFMNNDDVIGLIQEQMKNCKIELHDINTDEFNYVNQKQESYVKQLKDNSYASQFINLLVYVQNGIHPLISIDDNNRISKQEVRKYLGIETSSNFNAKVLKKTNVISFCETRGINLDGKYITFKAS